MGFLETIIANKKCEIILLKQRLSLDDLKSQCQQSQVRRIRESRSLRQALLAGKPFGLIAEIKLASPSRGKLTDLSCGEIARQYARSQADVISVLTDKTYFDGDISYLHAVRSIATQPVFRKDFIIDEYQIYETALAGADAFLLMASLLTTEQLLQFISLGKYLGLECLVETRNKEEIGKALAVDAPIIGINNRHLGDMSIDISTTEELMPLIPQDKIVISESGIITSDDVRRVLVAGVKGILVGTSLIESNNLISKIFELKATTI